MLKLATNYAQIKLLNLEIYWKTEAAMVNPREVDRFYKIVCNCSLPVFDW